MGNGRSSDVTLPHDDAVVQKTISSWRAASRAQRDAYDPANETMSELLFEMYMRSLRRMSKLRPATPAGLQMLAMAVLQEIRNSGSGIADDTDVNVRLMLAVVQGAVDVLGAAQDHDLIA